MLMSNQCRQSYCWNALSRRLRAPGEWLVPTVLCPMRKTECLVDQRRACGASRLRVGRRVDGARRPARAFGGETDRLLMPGSVTDVSRWCVTAGPAARPPRPE